MIHLIYPFKNGTKWFCHNCAKSHCETHWNHSSGCIERVNVATDDYFTIRLVRCRRSKLTNYVMDTNDSAPIGDAIFMTSSEGSFIISVSLENTKEKNTFLRNDIIMPIYFTEKTKSGTMRSSGLISSFTFFEMRRKLSQVHEIACPGSKSLCTFLFLGDISTWLVSFSLGATTLAFTLLSFSTRSLASVCRCTNNTVSSSLRP